jgi:putative Holliday junction resolvase
LTELGVIALDVGEKRVGVAATDDLGLTAQPLTVLSRKPHGLFLEAVKKIAEERGAGLVVLGLPRLTTGENGVQAQRVMSLAHELRSRLNLTVRTYDERLTTAMADRVFDEAGVSRRDRRQAVDMTAATLILDGYLSDRNRLAREAGPAAAEPRAEPGETPENR